jgi:hypothetical protein
MTSEPKGKENLTQGRSRRRAIACQQCRRKKLKCDLEYPACGSCIRSKRSSQCIYHNGVPSKPLKLNAAASRGSRIVNSSPSAYLDHDEPRVILSTVKIPNTGQRSLQLTPNVTQESRSPLRRDALEDRETFPPSEQHRLPLHW